MSSTDSRILIDYTNLKYSSGHNELYAHSRPLLSRQAPLGSDSGENIECNDNPMQFEPTAPDVPAALSSSDASPQDDKRWPHFGCDESSLVQYQQGIDAPSKEKLSNPRRNHLTAKRQETYEYNKILQAIYPTVDTHSDGAVEYFSDEWIESIIESLSPQPNDTMIFDEGASTPSDHVEEPPPRMKIPFNIWCEKIDKASNPKYKVGNMFERIKGTLEQGSMMKLFCMARTGPHASTLELVDTPDWDVGSAEVTSVLHKNVYVVVVSMHPIPALSVRSTNKSETAVHELDIFGCIGDGVSQQRQHERVESDELAGEELKAYVRREQLKQYLKKEVLEAGFAAGCVRCFEVSRVARNYSAAVKCKSSGLEVAVMRTMPRIARDVDKVDGMRTEDRMAMEDLMGVVDAVDAVDVFVEFEFIHVAQTGHHRKGVEKLSTRSERRVLSLSPPLCTHPPPLYTHTPPLSPLATPLSPFTPPFSPHTPHLSPHPPPLFSCSPPLSSPAPPLPLYASPSRPCPPAAMDSELHVVVGAKRRLQGGQERNPKRRATPYTSGGIGIPVEVPTRT
eukprot:TRINITY_DN15713_c0_g1_i1.p1 TRINITY_DN15713_c0_g1~~TRINITY_DN15713_c0_g1_i1.p1  ORF type:complete len:564 (-),score=70.55 TRINITY_DN15713_c0_g1_i1:132-1823(-)